MLVSIKKEKILIKKLKETPAPPANSQKTRGTVAPCPKSGLPAYQNEDFLLGSNFRRWHFKLFIPDDD